MKAEEIKSPEEIYAKHWARWVNETFKNDKEVNPSDCDEEFNKFQIDAMKEYASQFTPVIGESGEEEKETAMLDFAMYIRGKVLEGHTTNGQLLFWTKKYNPQISTTLK